MPDVASRDPRLVPFSVLYHQMMREIIVALDKERDPQAGHDYSHRVAHAVMLAAFVTEAAVNEIAYWLAHHTTQRISLPRAFNDLSIREKWRALPGYCGAALFDETTSPWIDFDVLIDLRNALVHPRAYPQGREKVLQRLDEVKCTQPASDWFESTMTVRTAKWASHTASTMPVALRDLLAPKVDLDNGGFSWSFWGPAWLPSLWPWPPERR
jgi:hypothetical protein